MSPTEWLVLSVLCLAVLAVLLLLAYEYWRRDYRSIARAQLKGPVLARNYLQDADRLVLCRYADLYAAREKWDYEFMSVKAPALRADMRVRAEKKGHLMVWPAFVYTTSPDKDQSGFMGSIKEAHALEAELVHLITGYWPEQMSSDTRERVINYLIPLEPDLFVPYVHPIDRPEYTEYMERLKLIHPLAAPRYLIDFVRKYV